MSVAGVEELLSSGAPVEVLVPCDAPGMLLVAQALRAHAVVLEQAGASLSRVEVTSWRGQASAGFADVMAVEPGRWRAAADGFAAGAAALEGFVDVVAPARDQARVAVELYQHYQQVAGAAVTAAAAAGPGGMSPDRVPPRMAVGARIAQLQQAAAAGGSAAVLVGDAERLRRQAVATVESAQAAVCSAGDLAAEALRRAAENAPQARRFWEANIRPADIVGTGHAALDTVGMIPAAGAIPDAVNAAWYLGQGNGSDAAISAAGMLPILGDAVIGGRLVRNASRRMTKLTDGLANPMPDRLYISGSRSSGNLTPRPRDTTGLSSFDTFEAPIFKPGTRVQTVETARLKDLEVHGPDAPNGHYSIRPGSPADLEAWIASRELEGVHPYTQELFDSLLPQFTLPKTPK